MPGCGGAPTVRLSSCRRWRGDSASLVGGDLFLRESIYCSVRPRHGECIHGSVSVTRVTDEDSAAAELKDAAVIIDHEAAGESTDTVAVAVKAGVDGVAKHSGEVV